MESKTPEPRAGHELRSAELIQHNVYITTKNGDAYRVWIDLDGLPSIELVERGMGR